MDWQVSEIRLRKYDYKLKKYCSNEGNIYTESLGELAYQNNPKFMKFIADNSLGFKAYASFGKNEITERIAVLVDLVKLVWNDDMFKWLWESFMSGTNEEVHRRTNPFNFLEEK